MKSAHVLSGAIHRTRVHTHGEETIDASSRHRKYEASDERLVAHGQLRWRVAARDERRLVELHQFGMRGRADVVVLEGVMGSFCPKKAVRR